MKKIIYTRPDGGVSVVIPAPKEVVEKILGKITDKQYKDHVIERSIPIDATNVREVDDNQLPSDRKFRGCWTDKFNTPTVDVDPENKLSLVKEEKKAEIKALRESNLNDDTPRKHGTYGGNLADKLLKVNVSTHLPLFESIIKKLERRIKAGATNPTRKWTDANGERIDLELADYESLVSHLGLRDENEHTAYALRIKEVEALTTVEEVEAYDISEIE